MAIKLYEVELQVNIVVVGEDETDAYLQASSSLHDIIQNENFNIDVISEVTNERLPVGWDGECIPYGGDGNTRIAEL